MCEPLTIAAGLAALGGTYMQYDSQQDAIDEQRKAAQAEAMRQSQMDKEKFQQFQEALQGVERADQQQNIDTAAQEFEGDYADAVADEAATYTSPAASDAPKVVKQYEDDRRAEADDFVSMLGNARARRNAWGENMYNFTNNLLDTQWDMGRLQTDMNRSAQIGELEARMAGQPGAGAAIGNALAGLGTAGLGYAGSQGEFAGLFGDAAPTVAGKAVGNSAKAQAVPLGNNWWPSYEGTPI